MFILKLKINKPDGKTGYIVHTVFDNRIKE